MVIFSPLEQNLSQGFDEIITWLHKGRRLNGKSLLCRSRSSITGYCSSSAETHGWQVPRAGTIEVELPKN